MKNNMKDKVAKQLADAWPSAYVARRQVGVFSGKAVASGTVSNKEHDYPCPGRVMIGRAICYPKVEFAEWLVEHFLKLPEQNNAECEPWKYKKNWNCNSQKKQSKSLINQSCSF